MADEQKPAPRRTRRRIDPEVEAFESRVRRQAAAGDAEAEEVARVLDENEPVFVVGPDGRARRVNDDGDPVGPGVAQDAGEVPTPDPSRTPPAGAGPPGGPGTNGGGSGGAIPVQLRRTDSDPTPDENLWTLIRNRTDAIGFNNYANFLDDLLGGDGRARGAVSGGLRRRTGDLAFLGTDGYEVARAATEYYLMQEVGLLVEDLGSRPPLTSEYLQDVYDTAGGITGSFEPEAADESRRRDGRPLSPTWLSDVRDRYLREMTTGAGPRVLPYLGVILDRLRDLPLKPADQIGGDAYGVLPSRLVGPIGLELIWSYWHEEGMLVQAHNAITNRFQNLRSTGRAVDPLARLEIDPLRRLNNVLWGWIQNRPFLLSVRRRAYEYDHHYGITLLGTAAGEVTGADSRSQFLSAFHNLLHLCTVFYQSDDDLTVNSDGFPLLNALRETQLVLTAGAHNQYGDLPWTARVEMLLQMWMLGRPEMREFLGGRTMVPYKERWMDRVDSVKSMMDWTDVNVTHFRDLGVFGEQILLGVRFGSWMTAIEPAAAKNWARYWRPEIQGYVHAYRAATGVDLCQGADVTMPGVLLAGRLPGADARAVGTGRASRAVGAAPVRSAVAARTAVPRALGPGVRTGHELR